ncbi:MAG TPA: TIGR02611 family protein [Pseudonocardiaceae bacterium]|nr:TIGR02611 family protein [Pseudonocardiaceae bacterium]
MRARPGLDLVYRALVAVTGTVVVVAGVIAIPYPGPGWLILFAGLAILGTEFRRARRVLSWARARYDVWTSWLRGQHPAIRVAVAALIGAIVLVTLWLVGAIGLVAGWLGLHGDWVRSPLR